MAKRSSTFRVRSRDPGRQTRNGSACESMLMHQVGHSRAQIMQDVQAGSINRIQPCDPSCGLMYAADAACRRPPTRLPPPGPARAARHRDRPKRAGSGTPGGTKRRRPGETSLSPGSLAPGQFIPVRAASTSSLRSGVPSNSGLSSSRRRSPPTNSTPNSSATSRSCHAAPAKTPCTVSIRASSRGSEQLSILGSARWDRFRSTKTTRRQSRRPISSTQPSQSK